MAMTAQSMLWIYLGEWGKAVLTLSIAECGQQSPKLVANAWGPQGFSPHPNNTHRAGSVWVFAMCAAATPPSLQKASSERCIYYHCNPFICSSFRRFLWNPDTKTGNILCLKCTNFNDKHMERTEARVTPRLQHCRQECREEISHIPPFAYLPPVHLFLCKSSSLWVTWGWNRNLKKARVLQAVAVCLPFQRRKAGTAANRPNPSVAPRSAGPDLCVKGYVHRHTVLLSCTHTVLPLPPQRSLQHKKFPHKCFLSLSQVAAPSPQGDCTTADYLLTKGSHLCGHTGGI